jgi:predicted enzyme related to lactoylglutathione lyase
MANQICHFEIGCRDIAKAEEFYGKIFDWQYETKPNGQHMIRTGADVGGHFNSLGHEPHHYVTFYVMVDDVAAALAKVEAGGGKKIVGPVAMDGGSSEFAWFADPEGNVVGLYAEKKK